MAVGMVGWPVVRVCGLSWAWLTSLHADCAAKRCAFFFVYTVSGVHEQVSGVHEQVSSRNAVRRDLMDSVVV